MKPIMKRRKLMDKKDTRTETVVRIVSTVAVHATVSIIFRNIACLPADARPIGRVLNSAGQFVLASMISDKAADYMVETVNDFIAQYKAIQNNP
jgi:hypothetical protein